MEQPQPLQKSEDPRAGKEVREDRIQRLRRFLNEYAWFIVRNLIGWILILASPPIGFLVPGPLGFPIFLIGFALITFPGKRKLTARVLRGRRLVLEARAYAVMALFVSIALPGIIFWIILARYGEQIRRLLEEYTPKRSVFVLTALIAILTTWLVTRLSLKILNGLLRFLPRFRRKFRPWLAKKGLKLLPPRRKSSEQPLPPDEILEIDPKERRRWLMIWRRIKPWARRVAAVAITVWVFAIMIRPLRERWPEVQHEVARLNPWRFLLASAMFASFLLCFRALGWRRILKGFGYKLPYGAATRIWTTSELARYLPGAIWQVVGRVKLAKPYGVPGSIVSTSQILEIVIFLLANVLIAAASLLWFGGKIDPNAKFWLRLAIVLVPGLAVILHPKIFYTIVNAVLRRIGKPEIVKRLRGKKSVVLLGWNILGLIWQSTAVYVLVDPVLHFKMDWWWIVAGAYCLAWCAGFLAFWAPGGIGIREWVFAITMSAFLPDQVRQQFPDPVALKGLLALLGFLLRLWTVTGELILAAVAYGWDWKGAMKRPDAPGRVTTAENEPEPEPSPEVAAAATAASPRGGSLGST